MDTDSSGNQTRDNHLYLPRKHPKNPSGRSTLSNRGSVKRDVQAVASLLFTAFAHIYSKGSRKKGVGIWLALKTEPSQSGQKGAGTLLTLRLTRSKAGL